MKNIAINLAILLIICASCAKNHSTDEAGQFQPHTDASKFQTEINGKKVDLITLHNDSMEVSVSNFGARIIALFTPDANGEMRDVILGYDSIADYQSDKLHLGALEGPLSVPLSNYGLKIDGDSIKLPKNASQWADSVFDIAEITDSTLTLRLASFSSNSAMPGNIGVNIKFTLRNRSLVIDYTAMPYSKMPLDMAHRLQFNLDGAADSIASVKKHYLSLSAQQHLRYDSLQNLTGHMLMNIWTPFDYLKPKPLTYLLNSDSDEVRWANGINTYFVFSTLGDPADGTLTLSSKNSGIKLTVTTDQNGVSLYTMNRLKDNILGKDGQQYRKLSALEVFVHNYPDFFNHPGWGTFGIYDSKNPLCLRTTYTFSN